MIRNIMTSQCRMLSGEWRLAIGASGIPKLPSGDGDSRSRLREFSIANLSIDRYPGSWLLTFKPMCNRTVWMLQRYWVSKCCMNMQRTYVIFIACWHNVYFSIRMNDISLLRSTIRREQVRCSISQKTINVQVGYGENNKCIVFHV